MDGMRKRAQNEKAPRHGDTSPTLQFPPEPTLLPKQIHRCLRWPDLGKARARCETVSLFIPSKQFLLIVSVPTEHTE